jgi:hypothetical protein
MLSFLSRSKIKDICDFERAKLRPTPSAQTAERAGTEDLLQTNAAPIFRQAAANIAKIWCTRYQGIVIGQIFQTSLKVGQQNVRVNLFISMTITLFVKCRDRPPALSLVGHVVEPTWAEYFELGNSVNSAMYSSNQMACSSRKQSRFQTAPLVHATTDAFNPVSRCRAILITCCHRVAHDRRKRAPKNRSSRLGDRILETEVGGAATWVRAGSVKRAHI